MSTRLIVPIVEGHGEERAVPLLVRRWLEHRHFHGHFQVLDRAINAHGCGRLKAPYDRSRQVGIEHYVEAALRAKADAILVILDADDECTHRNAENALGPSLLQRAQAVAPHIPLAVVVANREYEAWFLASLTSLRRARLLPPTRVPDGSAEGGPRAPGSLGTRTRGSWADSRRDCKTLLKRILGCPYEETVHQVTLTEGLSFSPGTCLRSPSYDKLLRDLNRLTSEARVRRSP